METLHEVSIVNTWLGELGYQIDVPLKLNAEHVCAIGHVSGIDCIVEVPPGQGLVLLHATLSPWPISGIDAEQLLAEGFLGLKTGGAAFAIDTQERELVMWLQRRILALDSTTFTILVAEFLDHAANWREALLTGQPVEPLPLELAA